jgi:cell division protein FtsW
VNGVHTSASWRTAVVMPRLTRPDLWLIAAVVGLVGLGLVMVFNVSYFRGQAVYGDPYTFFRKHLVALAIGAVLTAVLSRLRPTVLERWANVLLVGALVALVLVLVPGIGVERGGAHRWICTGSFCIQPSELAKLAVVIYLARTLTRRREQIRSFRTGILPPLIVVGLCAGLTLLQPDFGGAVILALLLVLMLFVAGARLWHLGGLAMAGVGLVVLAILKAPYRMRRLLAFWDPWGHSSDDAFQLVQSLIAFGSGGVTGVGLGQSRQKMFFLPEAHTDFIFALIGEELGLWGALLVLTLFAVVALRGFRMASRHPELFGGLLAYGITLIIVLGAIVNVAVVLGLLPTKGLALPFLSYGGSALIGASLEVGLLAALSRMTG